MKILAPCVNSNDFFNNRAYNKHIFTNCLRFPYRVRHYRAFARAKYRFDCKAIEGQKNIITPAGQKQRNILFY
jgi:hypothetical protein